MRSPPRQQCMHDGSLSRPAVAAALGVHVTTVRRLEKRGLLRAAGSNGRWPIYRADDVETLIKRLQPARAAPTRLPLTEGQLTVRAFELFRRGLSHEQVVIELEQPATKIREFFDQWRAGYRQPPQVRPVEEHDTVDPAAVEREVRDWEKAMMDLMRLDDEEDARQAADCVNRRQHRCARAQQVTRSTGVQR